jgi:toluene monooxygenase system ferredoxin subunit
MSASDHLSQPMPVDDSSADAGFVQVVEADELWDGEMESFDIGAEEVLVLKVGGEIRAYCGVCPHQSVSLVEGRLEGALLTCRAHEWQFDVLSGDSVNPKGECLLRHDVRVNDDGMVEVRLRSKNRSTVCA